MKQDLEDLRPVLYKKKMKFSIKDFFSKCDQILSSSNLRIWSHLLKKSLIGNFIFFGMSIRQAQFKLLSTSYSR